MGNKGAAYPHFEALTGLAIDSASEYMIVCNTLSLSGQQCSSITSNTQYLKSLL